MIIERGKVRLNYAKEPDCQQTKWPSWKTQWGPLFHQSFSRPPMGGRSAHPTIADFGLRVPDNTPVTAYSLCPSPKGQSARAIDGFWVIPYQTDELLYRESPQFLLLLSRRPAGAKPAVASFDCTRATALSEKTICSNYDLAAWDRSVSLALRQYLALAPDKATEVRQSQAEYLKKRDACGADSECIEGVVSWRVEEILQLY